MLQDELDIFMDPIMSLKWIILLLLLVLPIMIADIDTSMGNNNSLSIVKKQVLLRNHRFKRECSGCKCCCCGGGVTNVIGGGPHVIGGGPHVIGGDTVVRIAHVNVVDESAAFLKS
ncbi:unnamed protein product [Onchocerca ochengi]|uniref:Secreted protein n=1 Tax=Onchocerca ochengi TaxID=42157 RepID=A0A182EVX5_ONCOC|nr:unnamed protein product [Onchocerca ochengi]